MPEMLLLKLTTRVTLSMGKYTDASANIFRSAKIQAPLLLSTSFMINNGRIYVRAN